MSGTDLLLWNVMTPVFDAILNSGHGQVFWNEDDVKRHQVTVGHRAANKFDL